MHRTICFLCVLFMFMAVGYTFANNNITLEINGVVVQGGLVYVAVYSSENDYKAETPSTRFVLNPTNKRISHNLELPNGEYVVSVFQDVNSNGVLDANIFGIPREPVGITNYNGIGRPGSFQGLKVPVYNNSSGITVNIVNIR